MSGPNDSSEEASSHASEECFSDEFVAILTEGSPETAVVDAADAHMDVCERCRQLVVETIRAATGGPSPSESDPAATLFRSGSEPPIGPGDLLSNRYDVLEQLSERVFRVRDRVLDVVVAARVLSDEDRDHLDQIRQAIVRGRQISHPNICRVYDLGEHQGTHYVLMDLVHGESLASRMTARVHKPWEAWAIVDQIGQALDVARRYGLAHHTLDFTSTTIDPDGNPVLMGFVKKEDAVSDAASHDHHASTGPAAEIYALVVTYCELVGAGRPSWGDRPSLTSSGKAFERIAHNALSLDPGQRYQSMAAIRKDLDKAWSDFRRPPREKLQGAVALALAILLAVACGWWLFRT